MHARLSFIEGARDAVSSAATSFREQVVPGVRGLSGGKGAILLVDPETGKALGVTLWESEDAMRASEEAANALRAQAAEAAHATAPPRVERYHVEVFETF
jgi:heme-degrading monooxygenase HmoA